MEVSKLRVFVDRMLKPLRSRIYNIISRGVLEMAKDTEGMQLIKAAILAGENKDGLEHFQEYGFTSVPKEGAEVLIGCPQGNRDHMIVIKVADRRYRLKGLAEGEVAIYTDEGDKIHIKRGGNLEIVASTKMTVTSPLAEFSGDVHVDGNLVVDGDGDIGKNLTVGENADVTGIVSASGFSGLSGGPVSAVVDITTTGNITGGGTDLAAIKSTYNGHTHPETGITTSAPNQTL